jgi:hypothetical protein
MEHIVNKLLNTKINYNIILIIVFLCFSQKIVYSNQSIALCSNTDTIKVNGDVRIGIIKMLGRNLNKVKLFEIPKNNSFLFSISISVNSSGEIEAVDFSPEMSNKVRTVLNINDKLIESLKKIVIKDKKYLNKVLVLPIIFKRITDESILNLNEFLTDYDNLWPPAKSHVDKQIIFLKPFINNFFDPIR